MKKRSGAILLDVLLATFILSIGLVPLAGLFIQVSQSGQRMNGQEQAILLAQERMELLHGMGSKGWNSATLAGGAAPDFVEKSGIHFDRNTKVSLRTDLDPSGHLMEAEVCVTWNEKGQSCHITLLTYFAVDTGIENME